MPPKSIPRAIPEPAVDRFLCVTTQFARPKRFILKPFTSTDNQHWKWTSKPSTPTFCLTNWVSSCQVTHMTLEN